MHTRLIPLTLALLALAFAAVGGAASPKPLRGVFAGRVAGSRAFVALVIDRAKVRAYVCDSGKTAAWFAGPIRNGRIDLRSRGLRLRGRTAADATSGAVTFPSGRVGSFRALGVPAKSVAGLYRAEKTVGGVRYVGGWILLSRRAQRGAVLLAKGSQAFYAVQPAPQLNPESATVQIPGAGSVDVAKNIGLDPDAVAKFTALGIPDNG